MLNPKEATHTNNTKNAPQHDVNELLASFFLQILKFDAGSDFA